MRDSPVYEWIAPYLKDQGLPDRQNILSLENYEYALLCLDKETWSRLLQQSIVSGNTNISTGSRMIDELEAALSKGDDFHDLIERLKR